MVMVGTQTPFQISFPWQIDSFVLICFILTAFQQLFFQKMLLYLVSCRFFPNYFWSNRFTFSFSGVLGGRKINVCRCFIKLKQKSESQSELTLLKLLPSRLKPVYIKEWIFTKVFFCFFTKVLKMKESSKDFLWLLTLKISCGCPVPHPSFINAIFV